MPKESSFNARGRGSYASQACNICRAKKVKCNGAKPVCGSCYASGRDAECTWGRDSPVRKPRTEAHFEALRKRADALQAYVDLLEGFLAKCVCQDVSAHAQHRPDQASGYCSEKEMSDSDPETLEDEDITQELCVPSRNLTLDDISGGLLHRGTTAPLRFLPKAAEDEEPGLIMGEPCSYGSYVLLVDGVDTSGYDPNCDWARHLPHEVCLSDYSLRILDLSFKFFTMHSFRIIPFLFLRDMHRALSVPRTQRTPKTSFYSPMLHNALLGISAIFSDDPRVRDPNARRCFIRAAKSYFEAECKKPSFSLVHALSMIANFHVNECEFILGDLYFGMSTRISQSLGLEMDSSAWVRSGLISNEEQTARNWAHWTVFSVDLCWTLCAGREFGRDLSRLATPLPFVIAEVDQAPWHHPPSNIPPQPGFLTLSFNASSSLLLIGRKIADLVCVARYQSRLIVRFTLTWSSLELNTWKDQLPPELDITLSNRAKSTPQRLMLHCMYWWLSIVLHRPFSNRRTRSPPASDKCVDHVKLCRRAADNIMELLQTWSALYTLRYAPQTMLQVIFGAGTVYVLLAVHATSSLRIAQVSLKTSLASAELCLQYLSDIGASWGCASYMGEILRSLMQNKLQPIIARRSAIPAEIPSESKLESRHSPPTAAPRPVPGRFRTCAVALSQDDPVLSDAAAPTMNPPSAPYMPIPAAYGNDEERYNSGFDSFGDELDLGVFDAHGEPGMSASRVDETYLDTMPWMAWNSSAVWEDGAWGVWRGNLSPDYINMPTSTTASSAMV
ncbi:hypothetical protein B0H15DRAFT_784495 [Mycena belliarum]|uniref:Zn(2)-C6 fungal-type domain-containing protein n=1 Tax=Mycena belliarum TaxID=1033014 RepID=A0AAD6U1X6_9AGAR|nr:hypothetical protein B0H15DRAFT_784495 [Mycena belliae]